MSDDDSFIFELFNNSNAYPTRCNVTQFVYFCKLLYMFWVVPPPIIRSTKLYLQHLVLVKLLLLPAAVVEELELVPIPINYVVL
jgi:hypothetical protein